MQVLAAAFNSVQKTCTSRRVQICCAMFESVCHHCTLPDNTNEIQVQL